MLLRIALASLAGLSACAESDSVVNPPGTDGVVAPVDEGGLRQLADLSGSFAERFRIVGDGLDITGAGQEISLIFEVDGADQLRQFDIKLEAEPAAAFDLENAEATLETPFVTPAPNGLVVSGAEVRVLGASLTTSVSGSQILATMRVRTASGYDASSEVRLVLTSLSLGPSSSERDEYDSDLGVGITLKP